jgi:hypothetical protein
LTIVFRLAELKLPAISVSNNAVFQRNTIALGRKTRGVGVALAERYGLAMVMR